MFNCSPSVLSNRSTAVCCCCCARRRRRRLLLLSHHRITCPTADPTAPLNQPPSSIYDQLLELLINTQPPPICINCTTCQRRPLNQPPIDPPISPNHCPPIHPTTQSTTQPPTAGTPSSVRHRTPTTDPTTNRLIHPIAPSIIDQPPIGCCPLLVVPSRRRRH